MDAIPSDVIRAHIIKPCFDVIRDGASLFQLMQCNKRMARDVKAAVPAPQPIVLEAENEQIQQLSECVRGWHRVNLCINAPMRSWYAPLNADSILCARTVLENTLSNVHVIEMEWSCYWPPAFEHYFARRANKILLLIDPGQVGDFRGWLRRGLSSRVHNAAVTVRFCFNITKQPSSTIVMPNLKHLQIQPCEKKFGGVLERGQLETISVYCPYRQRIVSTVNIPLDEKRKIELVYAPAKKKGFRWDASSSCKIKLDGNYPSGLSKLWLIVTITPETPSTANSFCAK
jgi:hypothetical protein